MPICNTASPFIVWKMRPGEMPYYAKHMYLYYQIHTSIQILIKDKLLHILTCLYNRTTYPNLCYHIFKPVSTKTTYLNMTIQKLHIQTGIFKTAYPNRVVVLSTPYCGPIRLDLYYGAGNVHFFFYFPHDQTYSYIKNLYRDDLTPHK